jgi:hypothetical protein
MLCIWCCEVFRVVLHTDRPTYFVPNAAASDECRDRSCKPIDSVDYESAVILAVCGPTPTTTKHNTVDSPRSGLPQIERYLEVTGSAATDALSYSQTPLLIRNKSSK